MKTHQPWLFCLDVDESHLGNLGDQGLQVTLSSLTNQEHGEIVQVNAGVSILTFINKIGHLYVSCQRKGDLQALFGRSEANQRIQQNIEAGITGMHAVRKAIRIFIPEVVSGNRDGDINDGDEVMDTVQNGRTEEQGNSSDETIAVESIDSDNFHSVQASQQNSLSDDNQTEQISTPQNLNLTPTQNQSTPQNSSSALQTPPQISQTPQTLQEINTLNHSVQFSSQSEDHDSMEYENTTIDDNDTERENESDDDNVENRSKTPKIIMSSVGDRHIAFIDNHNRLFMMGKNQHGQLGTSDKKDKTTPTQVLQDKFVRFVTCGVNHTIACIEKRDGQNIMNGVELYGCGCNQENRLPHQNHMTKDLQHNDQFRKLHVPGLPWNIRQLESVKGMLFSMANYSPDQGFGVGWECGSFLVKANF